MQTENEVSFEQKLQCGAADLECFMLNINRASIKYDVLAANPLIRLLNYLNLQCEIRNLSLNSLPLPDVRRYG